MIDAFLSCEPNTRLVSSSITSTFTFNQEKITLEWYIFANPNGSKFWEEESRNLFLAAVNITNLPRSKRMNIISLKMKHILNIPELGILKENTSNFRLHSLGFYTIPKSDKINKNIFSKYNISDHGGFEINARLCITSIKFKYKNKNENENNINIKINTGDANSNIVRGEPRTASYKIFHLFTLPHVVCYFAKT